MAKEVDPETGGKAKPAGRYTYRDAGVDIDAGASLIDKIKPLVEATRRPEVLSGLGGFAGLCALPVGYRDPILVSGTDGVGTKLKVAFETGVHDTVGIDLVAMCVNDVATSGAEILFFLDYLATGKLEPEVGERIISGVAAGCRLAGCALLGGETAEMPGFYPDGEYDLSGFAVGVVERKQILDGRDIQPGDVLIGVGASGLHANGYSLARKILFEVAELGLDDQPEGFTRPVGEELLVPTRIYVRTLRKALQVGGVKAAAHITGGGLIDNPARFLPPQTGIVLHRGAWPVPPIFSFIQASGVAEWEMYRTFNMGLGLVLAVDRSQADEVAKTLRRQGEQVWRVGEIIAREDTLFPVELR
jgi:phosphoribosylformylglycinamidine cyclo-ligase